MCKDKDTKDGGIAVLARTGCIRQSGLLNGESSDQDGFDVWRR
jgi:hypothetical protein